MISHRALLRPLRALVAGVLIHGTAAFAQQATFPYPEKLTYHVEWRLVDAGTATAQQRHGNAQGWSIDLSLESGGLVSRLYRVLDTYRVVTNDGFCGNNAYLDAQEGKKHITARLTFDTTRHKVIYDEKDLARNISQHKELDSQPCTYDIIGALGALRVTPPPLGKSITLPITNGKKFVMGKIEAQGKDKVSAAGKNYSAIRYEAYLFDNVLYRRKGTLFVWLSDDSDHTPVQIQLHLGFPIGTVTVSLEKDELL